MQFTNTIITLAALFSGLAIAAPAAEALTSLDTLAGRTIDTLEGRAIAGTVVVTTYSGDSCNGNNDNVVVTNGGYRCFPVSNKRSIGVSGDCTVVTWSGTDCRGSSYQARPGCNSVLYGSVTIQC